MKHLLLLFCLLIAPLPGSSQHVAPRQSELNAMQQIGQQLALRLQQLSQRLQHAGNARAATLVDGAQQSVGLPIAGNAGGSDWFCQQQTDIELLWQDLYAQQTSVAQNQIYNAYQLQLQLLQQDLLQGAAASELLAHAYHFNELQRTLLQLLNKGPIAD